MSVAVALVPLALPAIPVLIGLRLVLGKDGFQRMVDSMHIKIPTSIRNKDDLESAMTVAGYDFQPWLQQHKTHLPGGRFFTWEFDGTKWIAVFPKSISQGTVSDFIRNVEARTGRAIFSDSAASMPHNVSVGSETIPTNFRDEALLVKALTEIGTTPVREATGNLTCSIGNSVLRFVHSPGEPYEVQVKHSVNRHELLQYLITLDDDYRRCVQAETYQHLKATIGEKNLTVESEEVLEDNSIVLTVAVSE